MEAYMVMGINNNPGIYSLPISKSLPERDSKYPDFASVLYSTRCVEEVSESMKVHEKGNEDRLSDHRRSLNFYRVSLKKKDTIRNAYQKPFSLCLLTEKGVGGTLDIMLN